jgi:hypothetical protein
MFRVPTVRQRHVSRAKYLHGHAPFWQSMTLEREQWNQMHPHYAIAVDWPPDPPFRDSIDRAYPTGLKRDIDDVNLQRSSCSAACHEGAIAWDQLILRLAKTWWPLENFPIWHGLGSRFHPALQFVSGCLLWKREAIQPEWITRSVAPMVSFDYRPDGQSLTEIDLNARFIGLVNRIISAIEQGEPLAKGRVIVLARDSLVDGLEAHWHAGEQIARFLYIFPGMSREDILAAIDPALDAARLGDEAIMARARSMLKAGASVASVAGEFGLSRSKVMALRDRT